jgi:hypothetical protein
MEFENDPNKNIYVYYDKAISKLYNRLTEIKREREQYKIHSHRYKLFFWLTFLILIFQTIYQCVR